MYTGGGSLGVEIERHVGGSDGYVVIEKAKADFVFLYEGAIKQTVTAPKAGLYTITALGAKGGDCNGCAPGTCEQKGKEFCYSCTAQFHEGGYGARARGTFLLSAGDEIEVVVAGKGGVCETLQHAESNPDVYPRGYNEVYTGGGGGGASSATIKYADGRGEDLLLIVGGGGGAARFFHGEDGEIGPNGGWAWGGTFGGGGSLPPEANKGSKDEDCLYGGVCTDACKICYTTIRTTGAGGGGVLGNGASRINKIVHPGNQGWDSSGVLLEDLAQGGFSLLNGGFGGSFVWEEGGCSLVNSEGVYVDSYYNAKAKAGGPGGFGSGGQGGPGKYYEVL